MKFISEHRKSYTDKLTFEGRKDIFKANYIQIETHNSNDKISFSMKVNQFSDWTHEEFMAILGTKFEENPSGEQVTQ